MQVSCNCAAVWCVQAGGVGGGHGHGMMGRGSSRYPSQGATAGRSGGANRDQGRATRGRAPPPVGPGTPAQPLGPCVRASVATVRMDKKAYEAGQLQKVGGVR